MAKVKCWVAEACKARDACEIRDAWGTRDAGEAWELFSVPTKRLPRNNFLYGF